MSIASRRLLFYHGLRYRAYLNIEVKGMALSQKWLGGSVSTIVRHMYDVRRRITCQLGQWTLQYTSRWSTYNWFIESTAAAASVGHSRRFGPKTEAIARWPNHLVGRSIPGKCLTIKWLNLETSEFNSIQIIFYFICRSISCASSRKHRKSSRRAFKSLAFKIPSLACTFVEQTK